MGTKKERQKKIKKYFVRNDIKECEREKKLRAFCFTFFFAPIRMRITRCYSLPFVFI